MPQFIISAIASLIFAIVEPGKGAFDATIPDRIAGNSTLIADFPNSTTVLYNSRAEPVTQGGANSYAIIFRSVLIPMHPTSGD